MSATYRIFFASGDRLRTVSGQEVFTAAQAAEIVTCQPYAWIDRDGDIIVNTYRTRCGAAQYKPVTGRQMAGRLRKQR